MKLTKAIARRVIETVDAGLSHGLGQPEPGKMCIEAAVCFAFGLPHGDDPPCVGAAVRSFKIALNDSNWSSDKARAAGMRKLAVAQLGSDSIDQVKFAELMALKAISRIVPRALRAAAGMKGNAAHAKALIKAALGCEEVKSLSAASYAASYAASDAASDAASYAASDAASYAASAARAASYAARAARAASDAASDAASYAARAARAASDAASYAASYAARAASYAARAASDAASDEMLCLIAECGLEALIELKSPGCKWLDLCEKEAA